MKVIDMDKEIERLERERDRLSTMLSNMSENFTRLKLELVKKDWEWRSKIENAFEQGIRTLEAHRKIHKEPYVEMSLKFTEDVLEKIKEALLGD